MTIIAFEDSKASDLHPITIGRPAYAITCAGLRLVDWLTRLSESTGSGLRGQIRPHLKLIQKLDFEIESLPPTFDDEDWNDYEDGLLLVNARLSPTVSVGEALLQAAKHGQSGVIIDQQDQSILVARVTGKDLHAIRQAAMANANPDASPDAGTTGRDAFEVVLEAAAKFSPIGEAVNSKQIGVFRWPHDVVKCHMTQMESSMNHRLTLADYTETSDGVFVGKNVKIGQYAVINTDDGPIIFEDNCSIGPFCYLSGPIYAGANARVIEHSALKDGVALGHTTKTGGEVEASVIEPYTNKQHHGFLGHSYLGSWINLGAGTCNSDLKNTYGKININYGDEKVATDMQFLGCFIGDYSKTAINTSIFTGKVIGVCSMMYGFVTSNVPSYVNYARLFGQTSLLPTDVMINTQKRMFARRKVQQRECDMQLIRDMYQITAAERSAEPDIL
ncbi:putative sugar nucleotidyl transferase [Rubripirellula obstinata]|nr:putative sugar nucleotidyl transferase [Rubripirellula obstinata]